MESEFRLTRLAGCAGCGAKVGAGTLASLLGGMTPHRDENLLVGFDRSDDAAVYRVAPDTAVVQTVDFFPPIADDPYVFGQIAAANALSDIYAMGGEPKLALNLLCIPEDMPEDAVRAILTGGSDKVAEAGALIAGGHSIFDPVPKYGLCVTGLVHPDRLIRNIGAQPGDTLLLTKPLGTGILSTARKGGLLGAADAAALERRMATLNKNARDSMLAYRVHAATDVTGFGLLGHLLEMLEGSGMAAEIDTGAVAIPAGALSFAELGILPEGMYRNRRFAEASVDAGGCPLPLQDALYDPQTSGGLLLAVHPEDAEALLGALEGRVPCAQRIGRVIPHAGGKRVRLL
ncbi:MAG: selenide, water dikinase SelD [Clostridia bacterium]|nr:selenide, water dikinase SelD [Clostridia bacterium]